jgi:hypothetical protein
MLCADITPLVRFRLQTPLDWAIATDRSEVAALLRSFGAHEGKDLPVENTHLPRTFSRPIGAVPSSASSRRHDRRLKVWFSNGTWIVKPFLLVSCHIAADNPRAR